MKVVVLMGGVSSEHKVSLASGKMVCENLLKGGFKVKPVRITKKGVWAVPRGFFSDLAAFQRRYFNTKNIFDLGKAIDLIKKDCPDIVFIALHGPFGEDGTIQAFLELSNLPYTGSDVLASSLGMDKVKSMQLLEKGGLLVPPYIHFWKSEWQKRKDSLIKLIVKKIGKKLVIKPANHGSSIGITLLPKIKELKKVITKAFLYSSGVIIQKYIPGREISCGVLDKGTPGTAYALPPIEIIPLKRKFFDYYSKYTPGASQEITPPDLPINIIKQIQNTALKTHQIIGASGFSRTDMIIQIQNLNFKNQKKAKIYLLEINTIPGLTPTSLLPQEAKAAGISFPKLLELIIKAGLKRQNIHRV